MKNKFSQKTNSDHLGWVVSLLAAAVILPTICLLWFMTQAVKNERLAVRQRLIDTYTAKAETLPGFASQNWNGRKESLSRLAEIISKQSASIFNGTNPKPFSGILIYDDAGKQNYPVPESVLDFEPSDMPSSFKTAWNKEFVEKQYAQAVEEYGRLIDPNSTPALNQLALVGKARCLSKDGKLAEAKELYKQAAESTTLDGINPVIVAQSRIRLAELYAARLDPELASCCRSILQNRLGDLPIPTASRVYLLDQILALTASAGLTETLSDVITPVQEPLEFDRASIHYAEKLDISKLTALTADGVYRMDEKSNLYAYVFKQDSRRIAGLIDGKIISDDWTAAAKELQDNLVFYRIYDSAGQFVCGRPEIWLGRKLMETGLFLTTSLGGNYSGWKLELYFNGDIFQTAAGRQQMVYIWSSVLVIGLMMGLVFLAGREILHQARLNTMKNNFVATVTHELKTPLSSMRLLVDTLLDGNYTNQQQCREYLELISRENHRLSRMIDSFLTFSRMERGKQVFDFASVNPGQIVAAAVEAVQTKFNAKKCEFSVTMDDGLPSIYADKDAMVTVLINLLDNACKYSGEDKKIDLKVFKKDNCICFSITDNGIGMTRWRSRRIFDKFYQVDSSLTRRAEGCGLGLSIVKYIVNAHKGVIDIESKPGHGSCFTVKLPI